MRVGGVVVQAGALGRRGDGRRVAVVCTQFSKVPRDATPVRTTPAAARAPAVDVGELRRHFPPEVVAGWSGGRREGAGRRGRDRALAQVTAGRPPRLQAADEAFQLLQLLRAPVLLLSGGGLPTPGPPRCRLHVLA